MIDYDQAASHCLLFNAFVFALETLANIVVRST